MGNIRKFKLKRDNKGLTTIKRAIACIGQSGEGSDFIFMNIKSKSFSDETYTELSSKILSEFKLPIREKRFIEMTQLEKEVYGIRKEEDKQSKMVICYDETNIKFKSMKNKLEKYDIVAQLITYFDMDALVIDENGKEINHWERFGIAQNDWFKLCEYIISEDGLGLSEGDINLISSEIRRMKLGEKTQGEKFLEVLEKEDELIREIEEEEEKLETIEIQEDRDIEKEEV